MILGFISIDCGIAENSSYTDETTGINYVSDEHYIDTGVSKSISPLYNTDGLERQLYNVRSFPLGIKSCYTLTLPHQNNSARYFIRARFMYGNYDEKNQAPSFDLYLGVNYWDTVEFLDQSMYVSKEILYVPSSNYTYVCLVNTGNGTPFISILELRLVIGDIYKTLTNSSLALYKRYDIRAYNNKDIIRFPTDSFDRVWGPSYFFNYGVVELRTPIKIGPDFQNEYSVPSAVMSTAITVENANDSLDFFWKPLDPNTHYFMYMHFSDFQSTQVREINITLNGKLWRLPFKPLYLSTFTIYSLEPETPATWFNFSFRKSLNSELPPILNAIETYILKNLSNPQTNIKDVDAIKSIKSEYGVDKNWQGDPCTPAAYLWLGLSCFNDSSDIPRISSLNLSFSELSGTISPSIVNLNMLQSLDLSNNNLTGEVPKFLSQMQKLSVLNLSKNNLTGTVPMELIKISTSGSLLFSFEGNPYLCTSDRCPTMEPVAETNNSSAAVAIFVAFLLIRLIAVVIVCFWVVKRRKLQPKHVFVKLDRVLSTVAEGAGGGYIIRDSPILEKRQQHTHSEVIKITRNFERVLGKGGFGSVFHGYIDKTQVAVKMLSPSSGQGYKQFKAEVEVLMRVNHRNLTNLVGFCEEGDILGLIYEYMSNGDLKTCLSDKNYKNLSWDLRLEIALDAAKGLEYLHTGCKPPIIHRDIKTTNILLNEKMQAKLADFGLSKAFPSESSTHVSTTFAGTPGYLDPEFNLNVKSDVYSFGVVLLEILTGKPPISKSKERTHISIWVADTLETQGDVRNVVDPRLGNDFDLDSVWKAVDVAMECVSPSSIHRPTMNHVVIELKQCLRMEKTRLNKDFYSD